MKYQQVGELGVCTFVRAHTFPQRNSSIPNGKLPMESLAHNFIIKEKGTTASLHVLNSEGTSAPTGSCT